MESGQLLAEVSMHSIHIVDCGRGPQLSTSRITMLDLVPYFKQGCDIAEIRRWIPSLTIDEVGVAIAYYGAHRDEIDELDDRARSHRALLADRQASAVADQTLEQRRAAMRRQLLKRQSEARIDWHPG
jgi:uncharacterized protein (DUF433 family)